MRPNPVKEKVRRGELCLGTFAMEFFTPGFPAILESAGSEFVVFDMEHTGAGLMVMKEQIAYCRGLSIVPIVRVPAAQYHFIARALDVGALGIMVPMVETREEAELIVASALYPPAGRRGAGFVTAHDDYRPGDPLEKMRLANARVQVICQIETRAGVDNIEEIASVDGVDVCWVGHFDLANFLGVPLQFESKAYRDALDAVIAAARRHGKAAGFMAADCRWAEEYRGLGFNMLAVGPDIALLQRSLQEMLTTLRAR